MRKVKILTLFFCLLALQGSRLQIQSIKNKVILQAREMGDTLIARLNNKLYYTLKTNNSWNVENGKIAFRPFSHADTSQAIWLEYLTDKNELVRRLRKGDTIRDCFMGDMELSFTDFTDVQVNAPAPPPAPVYKSERKKPGKNPAAATKKPAPSHPAKRKKKISQSVPFSKPIVFNNCVFGPIVADTMTDIYEEDAQKKRGWNLKKMC